jgi:hypothetical protein
LYADAQYYWDESGNAFVQLAVNRRSLTAVDEIAGADHGVPVIAVTRLTGIPVEVQFPVADEWTVTATLEHEWVHEADLGPEAEHRNALISTGVSWGSTASLTFRYEWTTTGTAVDARRDWFAVDATARISRSHVVTLMAGADRGGQVCANGICRIVDPFSGVRFSLLSYF